MYEKLPNGVRDAFKRYANSRYLIFTSTCDDMEGTRKDIMHMYDLSSQVFKDYILYLSLPYSQILLFQDKYKHVRKEIQSYIDKHNDDGAFKKFANEKYFQFVKTCDAMKGTQKDTMDMYNLLTQVYMDLELYLKKK